jgi:hypothetical protein
MISGGLLKMFPLTAWADESGEILAHLQTSVLGLAMYSAFVSGTSWGDCVAIARD